MFCPKCASEYREGFIECTDCRIPLVIDQPIKNNENDIELPQGYTFGYIFACFVLLVAILQWVKYITKLPSMLSFQTTIMDKIIGLFLYTAWSVFLTVTGIALLQKHQRSIGLVWTLCVVGLLQITLRGLSLIDLIAFLLFSIPTIDYFRKRRQMFSETEKQNRIKSFDDQQ